MIFKGCTELRLNEATVIEAIDYWLTNKIWHTDERTPQVTSVSVEGSYDKTFVVTLDSDEAKP